MKTYEYIEAGKAIMTVEAESLRKATMEAIRRSHDMGCTGKGDQGEFKGWPDFLCKVEDVLEDGVSIRGRRQ